MVSIVVVGGVALHIISELPPENGEFVLSRMNVSLGGPAGAVARSLASLGHSPILISGFAEDAAGAMVQHLVARDGISPIRALEVEATDIVFGWTENDDLSVIAHAFPTPEAAASLSYSADIGYVSGFPGWSGCASSIDASYLVVDLGFKPYLKSIDRLSQAVRDVAQIADAVFIGGASLSSEEVLTLLKIARVAGLPLLCISRGRRSAWVQVEGVPTRVDVEGTCSPLDVMSAGDALVAGFIDSISRGNSPRDAVREGLSVASRGVATLGDGSTR